MKNGDILETSISAFASQKTALMLTKYLSQWGKKCVWVCAYSVLTLLRGRNLDGFASDTILNHTLFEVIEGLSWMLAGPFPISGGRNRTGPDGSK